MSHVTFKQIFPQSRLDSPVPEAEALLQLADRCERAVHQDQGDCLREALGLIASLHPQLPTHTPASLERALVYTHLGACESAVLSLMPMAATYTGARLEDGTVIAQVALTPEISAHSRKGQVLAMAWLAALLRALSRFPHLAESAAERGR